MHGGRPAARHGDKVAFEALGLAGRVSDLDAPNALPAPHALNDGTREIARPCSLRRFSCARRGRLSRIDESRHRHARVGKVDSGMKGVVIVGKDDGALSRRHAVSVHIAAHGAGQHDAGAVVVAEHDGPLDGAGGEHRALGHDAPQALARLVRGRLCHMIVDALDRGIGAAVIDPLHGGAP